MDCTTGNATYRVASEAEAEAEVVEQAEVELVELVAQAEVELVELVAQAVVVEAEAEVVVVEVEAVPMAQVEVQKR